MVIELLLAGGYESVELRTVARQAKVSLATIYKHFPSRDALLFAAVERWMDDEVYLTAPGTRSGLRRPPRTWWCCCIASSSRGCRTRSWRRRGCASGSDPGGAELFTQGEVAVLPLMVACFADADRAKVDDVMMILDNVSFATMTRFADGALAIDDVLPTLERTVHLLVDD